MTLEDHFLATAQEVQKPFEFCNPVDKNGGGVAGSCTDLGVAAYAGWSRLRLGRPDAGAYKERNEDKEQPLRNEWLSEIAVRLLPEDAYE